MDEKLLRQMLTLLYEALDEGQSHFNIMVQATFALVVIMHHEGMSLAQVQRLMRLQHERMDKILRPIKSEVCSEKLKYFDHYPEGN